MEKSSLPAIEFRDVSLAFDERVLLDNVSFTIGKGEMRILVGPSNCGKSTIIKLAIGLLKPDSGQILINGREITSLNEEELMVVREKVGVVLQTDALFSMPVSGNVAYRLAHLGMNEEEIEAEIRRVLEVVGLEAAYDLMPDELSGGMSRRAAVARGLAGTPGIMLYDSPCSGLDPIVSRRMMHEIMRLRDIEKVSSIYVTQSMDQVKYLCSHLYLPVSGSSNMLRREESDFCLVNTKVMMLIDGELIFNNVDEFFWSSSDENIQSFIS